MKFYWDMTLYIIALYCHGQHIRFHYCNNQPIREQYCHHGQPIRRQYCQGKECPPHIAVPRMVGGLPLYPGDHPLEVSLRQVAVVRGVLAQPRVVRSEVYGRLPDAQQLRQPHP